VIGLPLLIVALLGGLQLLLTAVVAVGAQNAARTGARAASLGEDGRVAAEVALDERIRPRAVVTSTTTPDAVRVSVRVATPRLLPLVPDGLLTLTRSASMPR
jgi:hypothetical protein